MKTIYKGVVLTALIAAGAVNVNAQMTLDGEIRPRYEYRHGYKNLADSAMKPGAFISQRSRLNFGYTNEKLEVGISIQDVRVWGSTSQSNATDGDLSIHQAWAEYKLNKNFSTKFGRQEIAYDDERIFGKVDWLQQGRSHDAALLKYNDSTFTLHAGFAFNQDKEQFSTTKYTVTGSYRDIQYLWLNKKWKSLNVSYLALSNGQQSAIGDNVSRYSLTTGPHIEFKKDRFSVVGKFYYQGGTDAVKEQVQAYLAGIDVSCNVAKGFSVLLGYELQSGQNQTDTTKTYNKINHSFNPFFGTNHIFNGYMDYFYVSNHINSVGLSDIYARLKYKGEKLTLALDVHAFSSAANILDVKNLTKTGRYAALNSNLGTELDFTAGYVFAPYFTLKAGYSQMFGTSSLQLLRGVGKTSETSNWAYVMLVFKPNFMK